MQTSVKKIATIFSLILLLSNSVISCDESVVIGGDPSSSSGSNSSSGTIDIVDNDDDGLANQVEEQFGLSKLSADSDHDGFADGLEFVDDDGDPLAGGVVPSPIDRSKTLLPAEALIGDSDRDRDGLGNTFETKNSLNPDSPDTDGDGYSDALELVANSNPFNSDSRPTRKNAPISDGIRRGSTPPDDTDRDGIADTIESSLGSDANRYDTDTDGFSDGIEFIMGSDIDSALSIPNFIVPTP